MGKHEGRKLSKKEGSSEGTPCLKIEKGRTEEWETGTQGGRTRI